MNTTETFWDVDGVSLQTYAFNITTLGGDRMAPPEVRGDDQEIPFMPGTRWVPKVPDARTISLGMWVVGANEDGTIPTDTSARRTFDRNWRRLSRLLFQPYRQMTLTKRFWVPADELIEAGIDLADVPIIDGWVLYTAEAKASFASGLSPTMQGGARASFTVDLLLSDPYFYSDPIAHTLAVNGAAQRLTILGDARTHDITVNFNNALTAPRLTAAYAPEVWVQYDPAIASGSTVAVTVRDFRAMRGTTKAAKDISHQGAKFWLYLEPGEVPVRLTAPSGSGTAELIYRPAWL